jgi:purine-binding chemotaxis protein CheW
VETEKNRSDLILNELKKRAKKKEVLTPEEETVKTVVFTLNGDYYAFCGDDVKEIIPHTNIYYVPGTPDFILGVINIRGDIESVVSINRFLGLPHSELNKNSRIAIVANNEQRSGILLDSIEDVVDIPASSVKPPLSTLNDAVREYVAGETLYKGKSVIVINAEKIFRKITI